MVVCAEIYSTYVKLIPPGGSRVADVLGGIEAWSSVLDFVASGFSSGSFPCFAS